MYNVDEWYNADNGYRAKFILPPFEEIIDRCNNWLISHNYTAITTEVAKDKLLNTPNWSMCYPYDRIYYFIEKALGGSIETFDKITDLYLSDWAMTYEPKDHGYKAGETPGFEPLSKIQNMRECPNNFGLSQSQITILNRS